MNRKQKTQARYKTDVVAAKDAVEIQTRITGMANPKDSPLTKGFVERFLPRYDELLREGINAYQRDYGETAQSQPKGLAGRNQAAG